MIKKYSIVFFFCLAIITAFRSHSYSLDTRIAFGPSWRSSLSLEEYYLAGFDVGPMTLEAERVSSAVDSMLYVQGTVSWRLRSFWNAQLNVGGGKLKQGRISASSFAASSSPIYFNPTRYDASTEASLLIVDGMVGKEFFFDNCTWLRVQPFMGYNYNRDDVMATFLSVVNKRTVSTTWKGVSIGADCSFFNEEWSCALLYKIVFGNVHSAVINSDDPPSIFYTLAEKRCAPMRGNNGSIEICYNRSNCLMYGASFMFLHYKNSKNGTVTVVKEKQNVPFYLQVDHARLNTIIWSQAILTFFAEYSF